MNAFVAALCVAAVGATNLRANVSTASLTARINPNISQNAAANAVSSVPATARLCSLANL